MQKWEYCLLKQLGGQKFWIYTESGRLIKFHGEEYTLHRIIMRLGSEGWEAVNFVISDYPRGLIAAWPESQNREILFKRPTQKNESINEVLSENESGDVADWITELIVERVRPLQGGE
jgi:hypothetical protein